MCLFVCVCARARACAGLIVGLQLIDEVKHAQHLRPYHGLFEHCSHPMVYFSTPSRCAESAAGVFCRASSAWARSLPAAATHRHTVARNPPPGPRSHVLKHYTPHKANTHARTHTHTHTSARAHTRTRTRTHGDLLGGVPVGLLPQHHAHRLHRRLLTQRQSRTRARVFCVHVIPYTNQKQGRLDTRCAK